MFQISIPHISEANKRSIENCLDIASVSTYGREVDVFETRLSEVTGYDAICVNSGTSALELLVRSLTSNETGTALVAVSDFTFIATSNAVLNEGCDVCAIPIDGSLAMDASCLETEIVGRSNSSALSDIDLVLYTLPIGNLVDSLRDVSAVCQRYEIPLVVDAAAAIGIDFSKLRAVAPNIIACALSFNGNKVITSGAGGAVLVADPKISGLVRDTISLCRLDQYDHFGIGQNKKMPALCAALGVSQLNEISWRLKAREEVWASYAATIQDSSMGSVFNLSIPGLLSPAHWISTIVCDQSISSDVASRIRLNLRNNGINSPPFWRLITDQPEYSKYIHPVKFSEKKVLPEIIQLPTYFGLDSVDMSLRLTKALEDI